LHQQVLAASAPKQEMSKPESQQLAANMAIQAAKVG